MRNQAGCRTMTETAKEEDTMAIRALVSNSDLTASRVADVMHPGVLTCPPTTPLRQVARMFASYNVHCVVVFESVDDREPGDSMWGIVTDLDLVSAASSGDLDDRTAGGSAATPVVLVSGRDSLDRAVELMKDHGTSHLVVVEPDTMQPVGVLSALDVAAALAGVEVHSGPPRVVRR
jgi:CBS domain-containing protein